MITLNFEFTGEALLSAILFTMWVGIAIKIYQLLKRK